MPLPRLTACTPEIVNDVTMFASEIVAGKAVRAAPGLYQHVARPTTSTCPSCPCNIFTDVAANSVYASECIDQSTGELLVLGLRPAQATCHS
jgi:hypothetical protein